MSVSTYYAVIHKDPETDYGVSFPDFPSCYSAGSTLEETEVMAKEALAFHMEGMLEDGDEIPEPSTDFKALYEKYVNEEGFHSLMLVSIPAKVKKVRVNISVPELDLNYIDTVASKHGMDRSAFLIHAAKKVGAGAC